MTTVCRKLVSYLLTVQATGVKGSHFENVVGGKFCEVMIFSMRNSPLSAFVGNVVRICPKPKVSRIAASSVVAFMETLKAFRDWTYSNFIGNSVGAFPTNASVSISKQASRPNPAFFKRAKHNILSKGFGFRFHTKKTPAESEVKSASECGNRNSGYKFDFFTAFSATSRPMQSYHSA